jgi:hypothetical protein
MDNIKIILQMIKIKSLYIALILLLATSLSAQNKLWLANGKMKEIGEYNLEKKRFCNL